MATPLPVDGRSELEESTSEAPSRKPNPPKNPPGKNHSNGKLRKNSTRNSRRKGSVRAKPGNGGHVTNRSTNRGIEARRRKEKIRRRKRKHNRVTLIQKIIDRLETQPEVESRALFPVTCHDISYFVILFSVVLFFRSAIAQYTVGMVDQLQTGYLFSLSHLELVKGTELVGFVLTVILVAVFGRRSHRPLLVACGVLVLASGAIIWPVPYYMTSTQSGMNVSYGCDASRIDRPGGVLSTVGVPPKVYGQLCKATKSINSSSGIELCSACPKDGDWYSRRDAYLYVVGLAGFLIGFGTGLFLTSGTLYIEEASRPTDVPLKYGFLFFMSGLGEFLGSCFAWWFSNYPEDLKGGVLQPWSVHAWWLGLVIFACILFASSWIFLFFPKWIIEPTWSIAQRHSRLARLAKLLAAAKRDRQKRREQMKRDKKRQKQKNRPAPGSKAKDGSGRVRPAESNGPERNAVDSSDSDAEGGGSEGVDVPNGDSGAPPTETPHKTSKGVSFGGATSPDDQLETASSVVTGAELGLDAALIGKTRRSGQTQDKVSQVLTECFSAIWKLVSNPLYLLAIISVTLAAYLPGGYRRIVSRFVRSQYFYDHLSAFFYADGLSYSLADAIGSFAGGIIVWKLQLSTPRQLRLIISVLAINIFFFFLLFAVGCWNSSPIQDPTVLSSDICSGDCDCSGVQLEMVCSADGTRFLSPCAAGCTTLRLEDSGLVYSSCKCALSSGGGGGGGSAISSPSPPANSEVSAAFCSTCAAFGGYWILLFLSVIAHSISYVSIVLYFLRIVKEDERQLSLSFAVWIIALGAFVPGTAVFRGIESSSCLAWKDNCYDESVCWSHDVDKFRYVVHGSNIVFQAVAILGFTLILYLLNELNPCSKLDNSLEEFDLGEGQEHLRRRSILPVAVTSDRVLLEDTSAEADSQGSNRDVAAGFRESDGVSYSSPVLEFEDLRFEGVSPEMLNDLEFARTRRNIVIDVDQLSGESSL